MLSKGENGRRNRKETLAGSQHHIDELIERVMIEESRGWRGGEKNCSFYLLFCLAMVPGNRTAAFSLS